MDVNQKTVFVVLCDNYGDQGYDFHGVFTTKENAENHIASLCETWRKKYGTWSTYSDFFNIKEVVMDVGE